MVVVIDNYDSFTYSLVQYLGELGAEVRVFRNDAVTLPELEALKPSHIVISPGPGTPEDGGISNQVIRHLPVCTDSWRLPGPPVYRIHLRRSRGTRSRLMHGKTSVIYHTGQGIFAHLPNPLVATRYHSLIVQEPLPPALKLAALTREGEVMGIQHRDYPVFGVQFHPESILTQEGKRLLENFLKIQM